MRTIPALMVLMGISAAAASAQVTPAAAITSPDDTLSIRVGATVYPNYVYQTDPEITDADGNAINKASFDVSRAYLNITGNLSHIVAFRVTPDVSRENNTANSLSGSLLLRIKYAYLQTNLDDWVGRGSYARFGIQQTPYLDYAESIYRYRFQGTMFPERSGYFASADAGASFHYSFPSNYGDLHGGVFNGENYNKAEVNNQKAFMIRGSVRPLATGRPVLRGLRASVFYDGDHYVKDAERTRALALITFEHAYVTAGLEYLNAHDQTSVRPGVGNVHSTGYSMWVTPKQSATSVGWEGLLRYDHLTPNTGLNSQKQNRIIAGVAYWFPHQGNAASALLVDYDGQIFENITTAPTKSVAVHGLINF